MSNDGIKPRFHLDDLPIWPTPTGVIVDMVVMAAALDQAQIAATAALGDGFYSVVEFQLWSGECFRTSPLINAQTGFVVGLLSSLSAVKSYAVCTPEDRDGPGSVLNPSVRIIGRGSDGLRLRP